jgi:hypothetical protein
MPRHRLTLARSIFSIRAHFRSLTGITDRERSTSGTSQHLVRFDGGGMIEEDAISSPSGVFPVSVRAASARQVW